MTTSSSSSTDFVQRPLFGWALACHLPSDWRDVSDVRQVPDHQECWQSVGAAAADDFSRLLVIEILERQNDIADADAAEYFFRDLAESNGSPVLSFTARPSLTAGAGGATTDDDTDGIAIRGLPVDAVLAFGSGRQRVALGRDRSDAAGRRSAHHQEVHVIQVLLCAIRLKERNTDLLITLSAPISNPCDDLFRRILESIRINDWSLFG
jgi:Ran-interacting Mog1 protein